MENSKTFDMRKSEKYTGLEEQGDLEVEITGKIFTKTSVWNTASNIAYH
jgi:hypothetical protein